MMTRALTGAGFVAVMVGCILFHVYTCIFIFFVITMLSTWEFFHLGRAKDKKIQWREAIPPMWLAFITFSIGSGVAIELLPMKTFWLILPFVFGLFVVALYHKNANPFELVGKQLLGWIYIAIPFTMVIFLGHPDPFAYHHKPYHYELILGVICMIWANDTFAYLTGSQIGRTKLFERISPKKTWEGSLGGAVFTLIVAYVFSYFYEVLPTTHWMVIGGITVLFGGWGDLVESMFKRSLGVKDSGNILPGHGGLLDRFDAFQFCVPFVFAYLKWFVL